MSTSKFEKSANTLLSPTRIRIARMRRGLTKVALAQQIGVPPRTITKYENDGAPASAAPVLGAALDFPPGYFLRPDALAFAAADVNFRAMRRASAQQREAAVAAGVLGVEIDRWISQRFVLPPLDLPIFVGHKPRTAARVLRGMWGLGTKPLPNLVQLCESRGIRVYTLPPFADAVDAYSIWRDDIPYIFIARCKTPERIRFDLAHELGHLVLHYGAPAETPSAERDADAFASEFLMPTDSLTEYLPYNATVRELLQARSQFKVSAMALAYAAHSSGRLTDWAYRQICIELSQKGFRTAEPGGMPNYEISRVFAQVLAGPRNSMIDAQLIATDLAVPVSEVHALTFGAQLRPAQAIEVTNDAHRRQLTHVPASQRHLQLV
ncbi:ImmA/IrrE family metallo-endopeptidase [Mycobacterium sp. NPDC050853]|uniref:helix-turn-helix domain-containing protein n=1 Tax=Mycobacterium sp. NPDC050853 TaxID=3155160 RepID=UPI0033CD1A81